MSTLSIQLFDKLLMQCNGDVLTGLESSKAQELLCFLLLQRSHRISRETLAELLWDHTHSEQARKYLRKALWQIQNAFHTGEQSHIEHVVLAEHEWLYINPRIDIWIDVEAFQQAYAQVQGVRGQDLYQQAAESLRCATHLYRGELLAGWYQDWCLLERKRLQNMYLVMLDKLMGYCEAHEDYEAGIDYGTRILHCDRSQERTHRRLMRLYYRTGDRTAALRQYSTCAAVLDEDLGVQPARSTTGLYEQIRADRVDSSIMMPALQRTTPSQMISLPELLRHLTQVRKLLSRLESRVQHDIQAIEQALDQQP